MKKILLTLIVLLFLGCNNTVNNTNFSGEENETCNPDGSCNHSFLRCDEDNYCSSEFFVWNWGETIEMSIVKDDRTGLLWQYSFDHETRTNVIKAEPSEVVRLCDNNVPIGGGEWIDGGVHWRTATISDFKTIFEDNMNNPSTGHPLIDSGLYLVASGDSFVVLDTTTWEYDFNFASKDYMFICVNDYSGQL